MCRFEWKANTYALVLLEFGLHILLGNVGLLVPHVVLGGLIDLGKLLFRRTDLAGGLLRSIGGNILEQDHGIIH